VIEVEALTKRYGTRLAVDGATFRAEAGEILGLLGPNGAGKSSTMRILAGYLSATSGAVRVAGFDVGRHSNEVRRRLGYLPEHSGLYLEMRVGEYLKYRSSIKGVPFSRRDAVVSQAMSATGVESVSSRIIGQLSKGYRQRVSLAATLLHEPPVLILDEPTAGLDPIQQREIRTLVRELGKKHTVLFSTHVLSEAEAVCDRVVIMNHGRVLADGAPRVLAAEFRSQVLALELDGDPDRVLAVLARLDVEAEVVRCEPTLQLRVRLDDASHLEARRRIARALTAADAVVLEMSVQGTSLDDVFRRVTEDADARALAATEVSPS
jgi:ABC-2 type transport system ATP-binding protein